MDASIREVGAIVRPCGGRSRVEAGSGPGRRHRRSAAVRAPRGAGARLADRDAGRREVPGGPLPGLPRRDALHADPSPGRAQPGDRGDGHPDVAAPADPGHLPPLSPPAADHAAGRAGLAAAGRRPRDQPEPLRGQGDRAAARRPARLLLLHADAIRLAGARDLPGRLVAPARCGGSWPGRCSTRLRRWDLADVEPGHAFRGDLGDGPGPDRARATVATAG